MVLRGATGLDDVEGEAVLELHAGSTENGAQGTSCAALLANDFANVAGGDMEAEDSGILIGYDFNLHRVNIINEGPGNFQHQGLHLGDSKLAIRPYKGIVHTYTSGSLVRYLESREPLLLQWKGLAVSCFEVSRKSSGEPLRVWQAEHRDELQNRGISSVSLLQVYRSSVNSLGFRLRSLKVTSSGYYMAGMTSGSAADSAATGLCLVRSLPTVSESCAPLLVQ